MTKSFEVEYAPPPVVAPVDDDLHFQDDLERERSKVETLFEIYFIGQFFFRRGFASLLLL